MDPRPVPLLLEPAELAEREERAWRSGFLAGLLAGATACLVAVLLGSLS